MAWDRILREIEKCDVVCRPCHDVREDVRDTEISQKRVDSRIQAGIVVDMDLPEGVTLNLSGFPWEDVEYRYAAMKDTQYAYGSTAEEALEKLLELIGD